MRKTLEIIKKARELGAPDDYPFRGSRNQIIQQVRNWFTNQSLFQRTIGQQASLEIAKDADEKLKQFDEWLEVVYQSEAH